MLTLDKEEFGYRIGKLSLGPNEMLVFKTDYQLDKDQALALRDSIIKQIPVEWRERTMLLLHGVEIEVK